MTYPLMPERTSGRYAQQYAGCSDPERLLQILSESVTIALHSKDPDTATARYDLALEAYHQLRELEAHGSVHETVIAMVTAFPIRVRFNEATGLAAKARKLKTPKRKVALLRQALSLLSREPGAPTTDPECRHLVRAIATDLEQLGIT